MNEKCFCHFNGYEVKDAKARRELETLKHERIYSTDEVVIGTFLNKPLYRRILILENINLGDANEYVIEDASNYDVLFLPKFCINNANDINGLRFKMIDSTGYEVASDSYMHIVSVNNNLLYQSNMWKYIEKGYVVLEYTKIND